MVHISEITYRRLNHPNEELSVGDKVTAVVTKKDPAALRVALSIKRLQKDPLLETLDELVLSPKPPL
eukprot:1180609-Prorocentrum_minimum.AAC.2